MGLWFGTLIALILLIAPGAMVARIAQLRWPVAIAVGPALTYGVVALAIIPYGALGIPWNGWTALAALAVTCAVATGLQLLLARFRDLDAEALAVSRWPAVTVAAGVLLGALLIGWAAYRGIPHWQSIPSTWDAVWHANTVRFILDTGQASSTHMGELRNVETHAPLYYPSVFHGLVAVFCQLTGAAPTTGYTLSSLGRLGLAVSGQCSRSHLARGALTPGRAVVGLLRLGRVARRRSGGHRRGTLGVVHRGALRRVRYRRYAQPGGLRHRGADDGADHLDIAAPRPHPGGRASAGRRLLTAHYRRYRRSAVGVGLVAFRGTAASCAIKAGRPVDAGRRGSDGRVGHVAAVLERQAAGRHHRRTRFSHLSQQEAWAVRRCFPALPPSQRLPGPVRAHCVGRHRRAHSAGQEDLVAAGGLAAVDCDERRRGNTVGRTYRRGGRRTRRVLLSRSAPHRGGHNPAVDADGRCGAVRDSHVASGRGETTDRPFQTPAGVCLGIGDRDTTDRSHSGQCVALLSPAPISVRRQVRLGDDRPERSRRHGIPGEFARRTRHVDWQRQHGRHRVDVCRGRPTPAVDPLRLPAATGPGLSPVHLLGLWPQRGERSSGTRGHPSPPYPLYPDQHSDGAGVCRAGRTSVVRDIEVVGEDLRQRRGPNLRMARHCRSNTLL
ncbi:LOW QUALITY PROTEIN: transmembrane protein alanine and leucine rich, partial [Mycobacterium tuberculosis EAS054]